MLALSFELWYCNIVNEIHKHKKEEEKMMKVYLLKTDAYNAVIFTDGKTAKVKHTDSDGKVDGVDLYQTDENGRLDFDKVVSDLENYFNDLENSCGLNDYDSITSEWLLDEDETYELLQDTDPDAVLYLVGEFS